jgi:glyoxylase-like metal-dependent hydrolase (beta-lactamase superfamily II)
VNESVSRQNSTDIQLRNSHSKISKPLISQVSESVYCVQRRDYMSCSYIVVRQDGIVLVDSGIDSNARDMRDGLAEINRSPEDVKAILLTHWHNDHSSGAASIRESSGAEIYYHEDGHEKYTREARARGLRGWLAGRLSDAGFWAPVRGLLELAPPRAISATAFVSEGDLILNEFRVLETPGHEDGHVSYIFEAENVLFAGDALAVVDDHVSFMSRFLTYDFKAARESMLRCLTLEVAAICPGHRYPLIEPKAEILEQMQDQLENLRWWPIIGC